ncbi:hypothetical protein [Nitratireductor rhodophyticola]|uniref:hypothetical protein n=1 Tax=Nitratireductor rhodophyticola TaxID=2854036 RepID=UPI003BA8C37D
MNREQKLEEALERLLACPAIADGNHSEPAWGCKETAGAEAFARAALSAPKAEAVTALDLGMERVGKSLEAGVTPEVDRLARAVAPIAWLRDLDGTGSLHVCAKGDPDAIAVYTSPVPALTAEAVERMAKHITNWLGFSWDGLHEGRVTDKGFPVFTHGQFGWAFQGHKGDMLDFAQAALLAAFPSKGEGE